MARKDTQSDVVVQQNSEIAVADEVIYVGLDDGHADCKLVASTGETFVMPSRIIEGSRNINVMGGDGKFNVIEIQDEFGETESFTINKDLSESLDTRIPSYPYSSINLALVHSALGKAGLGGKEVFICTGLPVAQAYNQEGNANKELIDMKIKNLQRPVQSPGWETATIMKSSVCSEGVAAFFDLMLDLDGKPTEFYESAQTTRNMVIDIGGKTTDFAILLPGGNQIDGTRFGSIDYGILHVADKLAQKVNQHLTHEIYRGTDASIQQMIKNGGFLHHNGRKFDFSEALEALKGYAAKRIHSKIKDQASTHDINKIIFVGGGSAFLFDVLKDLYPDQAVISEDPQFANARGMLKVAKFFS